jgi:hypothetical protein
MDTNFNPYQYTCIVLDIFKFKMSLWKSVQNRADNTAVRYCVVYIPFTACLSVEPYDLFITLRILSVHVSSAASEGIATKLITYTMSG